MNEALTDWLFQTPTFAIERSKESSRRDDMLLNLKNFTLTLINYSTWAIASGKPTKKTNYIIGAGIGKILGKHIWDVGDNIELLVKRTSKAVGE